MSIQAQLSAAQAAFNSLLSIEADINRAVSAIVGALRRGGTVFACGNGGSSAEAHHLVTELVGRYRVSRGPLRSIFLGGDVSQMSCIANDFAWEEVFARPLKALGRKGDVLVSMSTSGRSTNVLRALRTAKEMGVKSVALLGNAGGTAAELADYPLVIQSDDTARIQEVHLFLMHHICDEVDLVFGPPESRIVVGASEHAQLLGGTTD